MIIRIPKDASNFITEEANRRNIPPALLAQSIFSQWVMEFSLLRTKRPRGRPPIVRTEVAKEA